MTQLKPQEILEATMEAAVKEIAAVHTPHDLAGHDGRSVYRPGRLRSQHGGLLSSVRSGHQRNGQNAVRLHLPGRTDPGGIYRSGSLFTGNNLMVTALLDKRISLGAMLRNWIIVYIANLAGSVLIAWMVAYCGLLETGDGMLKEVTISIAAAKTALAVRKSLCQGDYVQLPGVPWRYGCRQPLIRPSADLFHLLPIWLFVTAGFEHSVANMFFFHSGRHLRRRRRHSRTDLGGSFFITNLLPVTLGNLVGGSLLVGGLYYYIYKKSVALGTLLL